MKLATIASTVKSLGKILLLSRPAPLPKAPGKTLVVMGNGPSLRQSLPFCLGQKTAGAALMAVNFAANTPEFKDLRPEYYVLVDPLFFATDAPANVVQLRENINKVSWPMTLIVPHKYRKLFSLENPQVSIRTINAVGLEGAPRFRNFAYNLRLGMPRPRNVLIPAIMAGIWLGFKKIDIVGADHTWTHSLWVNHQNHVISVQPHFYEEHPGEQDRIDAQYAGLHLHDVLHSCAIAFEAHHRVAEYARHAGIEILNRTPNSLIDAYTRP